MDTIPITRDYQDDPQHILGYIYPESEIVKLMEQGYVFEVAPQIAVDGVTDDGEFINPKLISLSIISRTARKRDEKNVKG